MLEREIKNFYENFKETNPFIILGLMIISFGLYFINWVYQKNLDFEKLDKSTPKANRGATILFLLPFSWFIFIYILEKIIFKNFSKIIEPINLLGWSIILFLMLKYLYDFSNSFGKITKTNGTYWFFGFVISIFGILMFILKIYIFIFFYFILIIIVPAMQAELNSNYKRITIEKQRKIFYNN